MSFRLKKKLRKEFRKPLGKIVNGKEALKKELKKSKYEKLISIGDFCSLALAEIGITPDVSIIDGQIERKKITRKELKKIKTPIEFRVKSPSGIVTEDAWEIAKLSLCYTIPVKIFIQGEEDLLFLPICFFAPKNSLIVYGLKGEGSVIAKTDSKNKKIVENYLTKTKIYNEAMVGGTFDKLHSGHKFLLLTALENGKKIIIGITSEKYLNQWKKGIKKISSFKKRKNDLKKFLAKFNFNYKLIKIDDPFGPAINIGNAIVVSSNTKKNANKINNERKRRKIKILKIITARTIKNKQKKRISSTKIRKGEIDKNGCIIIR